MIDFAFRQHGATQGMLMIEYAFTKKNIQKSIAYKDMISDASFRDVEFRHAVAESAFKEVQAESIFSPALKTTIIAHKKTYQFQSIQQELVSRLVSKNIRVNYDIKQLNRQTIVRNAISVLKESSPFNIHRFDVVKFFESVDRKKIVSDLLNDGKCSRHTVILLANFFTALDAQNIEGLPRGIGISSVLAEYVMLKFDRSMRGAEGVFFYARFVDDIVVITSNLVTAEDVKKLVEANIPQPLTMHTTGDKVSSHSIGKTTSRAAKVKIINYLGYKFSIDTRLHPSEFVMGNKRRRVTMEIADSKILKMKSRLIDSFTRFISKGCSVTEYSILKNRLMALTGNYYISDPMTGIHIKTGIFFNYSEKNHFVKCELYRLDIFLRGLLYCKKHSLSKRIGAHLNSVQKKELSSFSFVDGFHGKRFYSFSNMQLREIKEGWKK